MLLSFQASLKRPTLSTMLAGTSQVNRARALHVGSTIVASQNHTIRAQRRPTLGVGVFFSDIAWGHEQVNSGRRSLVLEGATLAEVTAAVRPPPSSLLGSKRDPSHRVRIPFV